jgi:hypothetical protein
MAATSTGTARNQVGLPVAGSFAVQTRASLAALLPSDGCNISEADATGICLSPDDFSESRSCVQVADGRYTRGVARVRSDPGSCEQLAPTSSHGARVGHSPQFLLPHTELRPNVDRRTGRLRARVGRGDIPAGAPDRHQTSSSLSEHDRARSGWSGGIPRGPAISGDPGSVARHASVYPDRDLTGPTSSRSPSRAATGMPFARRSSGRRRS